MSELYWLNCKNFILSYGAFVGVLLNLTTGAQIWIPQKFPHSIYYHPQKYHHKLWWTNSNDL